MFFIVSKIFAPIDSVFVPASAPHPANTQYKISIGYEKWGTPEKVLKIQMVYKRKIILVVEVIHTQ